MSHNEYKDLSVSSFNYPPLNNMLERLEDKLAITWDDDSLVIMWADIGMYRRPPEVTEDSIYDRFTTYRVEGRGPDSQRVVFTMQPTELGRLPQYGLRIDGEAPNRTTLNRLVFSDLKFGGRLSTQTIGEYLDKEEAFQIGRFKHKKLDWN